MKKISVAIPTYEMGGIGGKVLSYSFSILSKQTFKDFDVVVSDHSQDNEVLNVCKNWDNFLDIRYYKNKEDRGSAAANTNFAIKKSTGQWIKILCQDDFMFGDDALEIINNNLDNDHMWQFSSYYHSDGIKLERLHHPTLNQYLFIINTLGTPSALTIRNLENLPDIDKNLSYCYDELFYWELWKKYGDPILLNRPVIVNFLHGDSISSGVSQDLIDKENEYILDKLGFKYE
jgi:glycosyltransferase involved in cell wall biosynthesis